MHQVAPITSPQHAAAPSIRVPVNDYSVTIHLLPHTDATRTTPPAQFDPERRDLFEGTVLKIGRQVRATEVPESGAIAAVLSSGPTAEDAPMVIEPPHTESDLPSPDHPMALSPLTPLLDTRGRAATSTAESPVSSAAVEVLLAQPGGQQPLVPTKRIEYVWFKSKVVSRGHAEMWLRDGQVYLKDTGSSSGTFLNKMRLSPSGKLSRPYPLKDGDDVKKVR
ncbi:hypothetical protein HDU98_010552 [Podochytrium sp. JEL0797]|nr:hypothetical protein HDU98_010552 [Podochytrium sp. JEL0797]